MNNKWRTSGDSTAEDAIGNVGAERQYKPQDSYPTPIIFPIF
jgi:hypothetical protein